MMNLLMAKRPDCRLTSPYQNKREKTRGPLTGVHSVILRKDCVMIAVETSSSVPRTGRRISGLAHRAGFAEGHGRPPRATGRPLRGLVGTRCPHEPPKSRSMNGGILH